MADTFNSVLRRVIFQELRVVGGDIMQLIPFVYAFYAFKSPLFYSHYSHDGDVMVIPSTMGIHQTNILRRALFTLTHLRVLHFTIGRFPSYLFPSIANDTHIINPPPLFLCI